VVTAVAAESQAVVSGAPAVDVVAAGAGPAAAAAAAARALTAAPYDLVVSAGIGGGFLPHAPLGSVVVADEIVAADLGAEGPAGFLPIDGLGFGRGTLRPPADLVVRITNLLSPPRGGTAPVADRPPEAPPHVVCGPVLTVSTATGTAHRAAELAARHPRAAAEAMEGFGVAEAAAQLSVPFAEIRAVSNTVGPRDRDAWRIGPALAALRLAFSLLTPIFQEASS
jgi:futalosine hydrolase